MNTKLLCIIPARAGSKRIPNKNIQLINGLPMLAEAIQKAQTLDQVDEIYVSSDSEEYLEIAKRFGAKLHKREPYISDDFIGVDYAIGQVIKELRVNRKIKDIKYVLTLFPCTPLLTSISLSKFVNTFLSSSASSGIILKEYSHPIQRALSLNKNYMVSIDNPKCFDQRTQDLEVKYHDSGQAYMTHIDLILKGQLINENLFGFVDNKCIDIDNIEDLKLVQSILSYS